MKNGPYDVDSSVRDIGDVVQNVIRDLALGTNANPIGRELITEEDDIPIAVVIKPQNTIRKMLLKTNTDRVFISTEIFNDIADVVFDAVRRNDFEDIKIPKEMLNEELCGAAAGNHKSLITEFIFNGAKNGGVEMLIRGSAFSEPSIVCNDNQKFCSFFN